MESSNDSLAALSKLNLEFLSDFDFSPMTIIRIPESETRECFAHEICNLARTMRNPNNDRNPQSQFH